MKRIEFIAPVEAMRGNLSRGKQTLLYAENNNPAWDAPVDKRSYARNYQPVFVGAKRSSDGHKYFSVKTKTATLITAAAKLNMALLAASSEMANVIKSDMQMLTDLQELFVANHPNGWSFKRWLMYYIREALKAKRHISFPGYKSLAAIHVVNPYISTTAPSDAHDVNQYFPDELLVKFWPQLADDPVVFEVGESKGIAHSGNTFAEVIESDYNVLGLISARIDDTAYAGLSIDGEDYILLDGETRVLTTAVVAAKTFGLELV